MERINWKKTEVNFDISSPDHVRNCKFQMSWEFDADEHGGEGERYSQEFMDGMKDSFGKHMEHMAMLYFFTYDSIGKSTYQMNKMIWKYLGLISLVIPLLIYTNVNKMSSFVADILESLAKIWGVVVNDSGIGIVEVVKGIDMLNMKDKDKEKVQSFLKNINKN